MFQHARILSSTSLFVLAMVQGSVALAQDRDDEDSIIVIGQGSSVLLEESATGSRLGISPLQTPAAINVLDGEAIRARGDFGFIDAVTRAPGVSSSATPGNGGTALVVRGFSGQGSVTQLYNGVRLIPNNSSITFPFDTWNIERIEVLNGPASVLYGQGSLGGVVNVVPKSANFDRLEFQGQAGYGSFDTLHLAGGVSGPVAEGLALRADASFRQSDGYVDRGNSESLALSTAIEYRPSDRFSASLRHDFGHDQPMRYNGTPLADGTRLDTSIRRKNYDVADSVMDYKDHRTQLSIEWAPLDDVKFASSSFLFDSLRRWETLEAYSWNTTTDLVSRTANTGIVHDVLQWGNQTSLSYKHQFGGGVTNQLLFGIDYNELKLKYSHNFADEVDDTIDPYDFDPGSFLNTVGIEPRYRTHTAIYAVFLENRLELGEKLSIIGGLRYESDRVGRWNYVYDAAGETIVGEAPALNGGTASHKTFRDLTWRVGTVYQPTPELSFYAQYVTGVDPVGNLTSFSGSSAQYGFSNASGHQVEAGVKSVFLGGRGSATLAVYRLAKNDLTIQRSPLLPLEQIGKQSSQGIEASVSLQLPAGFAIEANGTVLDANYDDFSNVNPLLDYTGNTPIDVPEVTGNATLTWQPIARLAVNTSLRYVGRRFMDQANTKEIPDYLVVDAGASFAVTENLAVRLRLYNLFDKDYALSSNYGSQWILGRPRSVDVAIRANF